MFVKTVKYKNFNDMDVEENCYFNLTKAELTEMQLSVAGTFSEKLTAIFKRKDVPLLMKYLKEILLASYGVKSDDGNRFIKNDKVREDFLASPAYDIIFCELMDDPNKAYEFLTKIIPIKITPEDIAEAKKQLEA